MNPWNEVKDSIIRCLEQNEHLKERVCELAKEVSHLRSLLKSYQHEFCWCPVDEPCTCGNR